MINLLPAEQKKEIRAARSNVLLLRYVILLLAAAAFLGVAMGTTYVALGISKTAAQNTIQENQKRVADYAAVESEAATFRSNLATAQTILANEVVYSKVITSIANTLPSGVILTNLQLDSSTFGKPMTLTAQARNSEDAIKLKTAFESSSIFSDVHFQTVTTGGAGGETGAYPVTVTLEVTLNKSAIK